MKKESRKLIKFSNLIAIIIFSVVCIITTVFTTKPKDYSYLTEYTSALSLNEEVQICNLKELYIKHVGGNYYYANIYNDDDDIPIFTYQGQRLKFQFDSEVIEYSENAPAKCRIVSRDSRITGTFEFELRPRELAEREQEVGLYAGYLVCGIVVAALLTVLKALVSNSSEELSAAQNLEKDLLYAIKNYDLGRAENADIKSYVTKKMETLGYDSQQKFMEQKEEEKRRNRRRSIKTAMAEYLISSGWLCGITALIVSIFTADLISGFPVLWLISVPIVATGYILKRKSVGTKSKAKEEN